MLKRWSRPADWLRYNHGMTRSMTLVFVVVLACGAGADTAAPQPPAFDAIGEPDAVAGMRAQLEVREYADVARKAEDLIVDIEAQADRYDPTLIAPLTVLGDARVGLGEYDAALEAYDRAKHITRITDGVQSLTQVELLYREADALETAGDRKGANERHELAYSLKRRHSDTDTLEFLPAISQLISWYRYNYKFRASQLLYERALDTMREHYEPDDERLIAALRGYADTFKQRRFGSREQGRGGFSAWPPGEAKDPPWYRNSSYRRARNTLREVVELTEGKPGSTDGEIATAVLELGDWHLLYREYGIAMRYYRRVWSLLQSDARARAAVFDSPTPLYVPTPDKRAKQVGAADRPDGVVVLALTITHRGDVVGRKTLLAEPHNIMEFKVRKAAKRAIYRPAFANADPVRWNGLEMRYRYEYHDDQLGWSR